MARRRRRSRIVLSAIAILIVGAALAAAFWPRAVLVDLGAATRGPMTVTIDEEGRTRVSEPYVVSTPVAGRLQRVQVEPGDAVVRGETLVAHMRPSSPAALDVRTREQAQAAVAAAEAALRVARADLNAARADRDLAETEFARTERLAERDIASPAALDQARQAARVAEARVETAEAAIAMREADLQQARAQLIGFDDRGLAEALSAGAEEDIPLRAPADGRILRVMQQSETTLPAGAPIMEIGDVEGDLEVVVELISSDAVQVNVGDRAVIEDWGGAAALDGEVTRIDPFARTKVSALGVEEARVPVTVAFTGPAESRRGLGHGYRVEVRIVVWEADEALRIPSSALFRDGESWAVFRVETGRAALTPVEIGRENGRTAQVTGGLAAGDTVVLYPSAAVVDGARVARRRAE